MNPFRKWQSWAALEGATKALTGTLQKVVGTAASAVPLGFLVYLAAGLGQIAAALAGALRGSGLSALAPRSLAILWPILFGLVGTAMYMLGIYTFSIGADLGVRTLIVIGGIIPGAALGMALFRDSFSTRNLAGVALFLAAVWAMLDFPAHASLEPWVWWTIVIACLGAVNEVAKRKSGNALPQEAYSFWIGVSTILWCALGFSLFGPGLAAAAGEKPAVWVSALVLAVMSPAMALAGFFAYKVGAEKATIHEKKFVMDIVYLVLVTAVGIAAFNEPITIGKFAGVLLAPFAYLLLMKKEAWERVVLRRKPAA